MRISDKMLPPLESEKASLLMDRTMTVPLYAHAYSFHLNFRFGVFKPTSLLAFAVQNKLSGVKIHLLDGEENCLGKADEECLSEFRQLAHRLGLDVHLEISETSASALQEAVRVGSAIGASSIRCYPRYEGSVSSIIQQTVSDLRLLSDLDPVGQFRFTIEQHEDLKGEELVRIVEAVENPNLSLLFDFTNMINAYEQPLPALKSMAAHITDVHIKDATIVEENGGWGQKCCRSGEGGIPQARLLMELLCLGDTSAQVAAYGLEEEVGYTSRPYRFPDESSDPHIPYRDFSETELLSNLDLATHLAEEIENANHLCAHVQTLLKQLRQHAALYL